MKPKTMIMMTDPSIGPSVRPTRYLSAATRGRLLIVSGAAALLIGAVSTLPGAGRAAHSTVWFNGNDAPVWSPDGTKIAFTSFRGGHPGEIYVMRPDGSGQRDLTNDRAYDDLAAWSPDGTRIAFTSNRDGNDEIYVMNADGSGQTRLTRSLEGDFAPSWAPDGRRIAFWSTRDGNAEIYTMNANGTGERRLTSDPGADESPNWGPDGRIAFFSNRGTAGRTAIFVMNSDGSAQRRLTDPTVDWNESRPVWSPDGSRIAFVSSRDFPVDNTEIYEMNADGSGETRITRSPQHDDWPTWSPDGTKLAFSHGSLLMPEIYRINVDGSGIRLLSRKGVVLETRFLRVPDAVAGRRFTVTLGVSTGTGASVVGARTSCNARVGRVTLRGAAGRFARSEARCTWALPRSSRGKWIYVRIGARLGSSLVAETLTTRVS
jgi:Tol biopolymer transport system component